MSSPRESGGALAGLRVVELASFIAGPYCGQLLSDLGAQVTKIERPPHGDPFRRHAGGDYSHTFVAYNRNKRSALLDLSEESDRELLRGLLATADVFVENNRPHMLERFGLDYEHVAASNPGLVYCSITGFGPTGPYATRPAYDTVGQALSGMLSLTLDEDRPRIVGPAFSDGITALTAAYAILAALQARERTGAGQHVHVPLISATAAFLTAEAVEALTDAAPSPHTRPSRSQAYAGRCADGRLVAVHLSSPQKFWVAFTAAIERPDLASDARYLTHTERVHHYEELVAIVQAELAKRTRDDWLAIFAAHDVPAGPVYTMGEVFSDRQAQHLGLELIVHHHTQGAVTTVAPPVQFSRTPTPQLNAPPLPGEHTADVRAEVLQAARSTSGAPNAARHRR